MAANSSSPPPVLPVEEAVEHAAETGHVPNNAAAEVAEHGEGGLPQFAFEHWAGQIAYLLILFAILLFLVSKVFAPRLRRVMDERADTISTAVATARKVQAEAAEQAAAAKARVTEEANARQAAEEAVVNARISDAEDQIAVTRDAAMANVSAIASDTARAMVERLTGQGATDAELATAKGA